MSRPKKADLELKSIMHPCGAIKTTTTTGVTFVIRAKISLICVGRLGTKFRWSRRGSAADFSRAAPDNPARGHKSHVRCGYCFPRLLSLPLLLLLVVITSALAAAAASRLYLEPPTPIMTMTTSSLANWSFMGEQSLSQARAICDHMERAEREPRAATCAHVHWPLQWALRSP